METYFDKPERLSQDEIRRKNLLVSSNEVIIQMLESCPQPVLILDLNRQIVAANKNALTFLEQSDLNEVLGKRLGESFNCIRAFDEPAGCGTSNFCPQCGAAQSIKKVKDNGVNQIVYECRIITNKNGLIAALDLRVLVTSISISGEKYLLVYIENLESEKRREALEKIFFHDILNISNAIQNLVELVSITQNKDEMFDFISKLKKASSHLANEIIYQRMILSAEKNNLTVKLEPHSVNKILETVNDLYYSYKNVEGKIVEIDYLEKDFVFETDKTILIRSLGNLIKNALEASNVGQKIKLFVRIEDNTIYFNVWNEGVIPEEIQLQIFQRSFSTKAKAGRGIGTYSVKMLVENFLKGEVYFISSESEQTCFTIKLPISQNYSLK